MCDLSKSLIPRNTTKLKEVKSKYEQGVKDGIEVSDLKKQLEELDVKRIALEDHEEQMRKKEKVVVIVLYHSSSSHFEKGKREPISSSCFYS